MGCEIFARGVDLPRLGAGRRQVEVVLEGAASTSIELAAQSRGYFAGCAPAARVGDRYRFRLDGDDALFPESRLSLPTRRSRTGLRKSSTRPSSRGPTLRGAAWSGVGQILYEMHIGTFTREGTWAAALAELPALAELGVTVLEIMPIADFSGRFGWGYDGVNWFAPHPPLRFCPTMCAGSSIAHIRLVSASFSTLSTTTSDRTGTTSPSSPSDYISGAHMTEWGTRSQLRRQITPSACASSSSPMLAIGLKSSISTGFASTPMQSLFDASPTHIVGEIATAVREAAGARAVYVIAENERQEARLVRPPIPRRSRHRRCLE